MKIPGALLLLAILSVACSTSTFIAAAPTPTAIPTAIPTATATPRPKVTVPSATLMSPDNAVARLLEADLRAEKIEERSDVCAAQIIFRQDPVVGTQVEAGSTVKIFLCVGPTPTPAATATPRPTATPVPPTAIPTLAGPPRRLRTGEIVKQDARWQAGDNNNLTIQNDQALDAVVIMVQDNIPLYAVYIRASETFKIDDILHGGYYVYFTLGEDWDSASGTFTRKTQYHGYSNQLNFQRNLVAGHIEYTYYTGKLYSGPDTVPVSLFPKLK